MNPNALNFASAATQDDGACTFLNLGCTDSNARNYESAAEAEHYDYAYRCRFITYGCQNEYSWNYNAAATDDDGSCLPLQSSVPLPGKIAAEGFCFEPDCATTPGFGLGASTCAINSVKSLYESMFTTATQTASEYLCSSALPAVGNVAPAAIDWPAYTYTSAPVSPANYAFVAFTAATLYCGTSTDPYGTCMQPVLGCTDPTALNYDPLANQPSGLCQAGFPGCMDSTSISYSSIYNVHDAAECLYPVAGCTIFFAINYNPLATLEDESCTFHKPGCTDSNGLNYGAWATQDDGTCILPVYGCKDPSMMTFDSHANMHVQSDCVKARPGCQDSAFMNYDALANSACPANAADEDSFSACPCALAGCIDSLAINYNANANAATLFAEGRLRRPASTYSPIVDDFCEYEKPGCMDSHSQTYATWATLHDASFCLYTGCTDSRGLNFDATATIAGECDMPIPGCTDSRGNNFQSTATVDDGTCEFLGCMDTDSPFFDPVATLSTICPWHRYGCKDNDADNYDTAANFADNSQCIYEGCMDSLSAAYQSQVTVHQEACCWPNQPNYPNMGIVAVCMDSTYDNYLPQYSKSDWCAYGPMAKLATTKAEFAAITPRFGATSVRIFDGFYHDQSECLKVGCMDSLATNFDPIANVGSLCLFGCLEGAATGKCSGAYNNDGDCDDGGAGSEYAACLIGQDCTDCGSRTEAELISVFDAYLSGASRRRLVDGSPASQVDSAHAKRQLQSRGGFAVTGCTDPSAVTYDSLATVAQSSACIYPVTGCTDSLANNYLAAANTDSGLCQAPPVAGCTTVQALNYNSNAQQNDGSCRYQILGCTDSNAINYAASANSDSGNCRFPIYGCMVSTSTFNYDSNANANQGCRFVVSGCMDSLAANFNPNANTDAGIVCEFYVGGCMAPVAVNYNSLATRDDQSCVMPVEGCTDSMYTDYDAGATVARPNAAATGGCTGNYIVYGCTSNSALNYNSIATVFDSSCVFGNPGCTDSAYSGYNAGYNVDDGSCASSGVLGCTTVDSPCYNAAATIDDGSCNANGCVAFRGCTDSRGQNYNANANVDNGQCVILVAGCGAPAAANYDSTVTAPDPALCLFPPSGCTDSVASNYLSSAEVESGSCAYGGCTNSIAENFNPSATFSEGASVCVILIEGCTDSTATNFLAAAGRDSGLCQFPGCMDSDNPWYDATATIPPEGIENGGCKLMRPGCTNSHSSNYEVSANTDDGSCFLVGCTNPLAPNYESWALVDSGECDVGALGCTNSFAINYLSMATADAGDCIIQGCLDSLAINYNPMANSIGEACIAARLGCTDSLASNFDVSYNVDSGMCTFPGCTDSLKLGYMPEANLNLLPGVNGSCIDPFYGCTDARAANYNSTANADDSSCVIVPPSSPPASPTVVEDVLYLGITTSYTLEALDLVNTADSVASFIASVPATAPTFAEGRRLMALPDGGRLTVSGRVADVEGRMLQSTSVEPLAGWVAEASWRDEFPRRVARLYWLPRAAVTLASATPGANGGTRMQFNMAARYLPYGATAAGLKTYAETLQSTVYSQILAVPVTALELSLMSETVVTVPSPPPLPLPPAVPPVSGTMAVTGMAPGAIVGIVVPVAAIIIILGGGFYYYRQRKAKRMPMATVQPQQTQGPVGGQLLVQPPELPDGDD